MLVRQITDDHLAQNAYLIGCQQTGEAIVIDPERDVERYIEAAARENLKLVAATDLPSGHVLTRADVAIKSPNDGLPPYELDQVLGRRLRTQLRTDENLRWEDLTEAA